MPMLKIEKIRDMSSEERKERLTDMRAELLRLKTMIKAGGTVEDPARIKEMRKTIARILTVENERKPRFAKKDV